MKFSITTENLRKALARIGSVPGVINSHLPTLACVIEADDFSAKLRRTTAIASVSVALEASIDAPGACAINYETFCNAVNAMACADTELEADAKALRIKSGKTKGELNAYPPDEILPLPDVGAARTAISFSTADLLGWLATAKPAAATDSKEAKFAGVCLRVMHDRLALFAVDRRRSHVVYVGGKRAFIEPADNGKDRGVLLVNESIAALQKLLPETDTRVDITLHDGSLTAKVADVEAILPLGTDAPPDMEPFLPAPAPAPVVALCRRAELLRAVRTAAPLGFQDNRVISVFFHEGELDGGSVEIVADNKSGAKLGHEVDATVTGNSKHLRATGQYLVDLIDAMPGEEIEIHYMEAKQMLYSYTEDRMCILLLVRDSENT